MSTRRRNCLFVLVAQEPRLLVLIILPWLASGAGCNNKQPPAAPTNAVNGLNRPTPDNVPDYAIPQSAGAATIDKPQVVTGNIFEDFDYAFTIERPSSDWQFLHEERARSINADAVLGMVNSRDNSFAVVIADRMDGIDLNAYTDLILNNSPLGASANLHSETAKLDGWPARLITSQAVIENIDFTYRIAFLKRDDFFYQIMTWTLTANFKKNQDDFESIVRSIHLIKNRQPQNRIISDSRNEFSTTWKIADGVYTNAAFGLRLTPSTNFRMASQVELNAIGPDATAGMIGDDPIFYQLIIVEPIGGIAPDDFAAAATRRLQASLNIPDTPSEVNTVTVGGVKAKQQVFREVTLDGAKFDFGHTYFFRDSIYYRIQSWWSSADSVAALSMLNETYQFVNWLDDSERRTLISELMQLDMNNSVGPKYALRNRMFRDFEYGFNLKIPDGLWIVDTGDTAKNKNPAARLLMSEATTGVYAVVIPEIVDFPHEQYHGLLRESIRFPENAQLEELAHGDITLLRTKSDREVNSMDYSFQLVTAKRGKRAVQILTSALKSQQRQLDIAATAMIDGFGMPKVVAQAITVDENRITDHRLGFRLSSPSGWKLSESPIPQLQSVGSVLVMSKSDVALLGMGVCSPHGLDEDFAMDAMMRSSGIQVDPSTRQETRSKLAGLPARKISMIGTQAGKPAFMKAWLATQGHTMYVCLIIGERNGDAYRNSDGFVDFFSLVD